MKYVIPVIEIVHDMSEAWKNTNVHKNCLGSKGLAQDSGSKWFEKVKISLVTSCWRVVTLPWGHGSGLAVRRSSILEGRGAGNVATNLQPID
jgi:hypothetical protein